MNTLESIGGFRLTNWDIARAVRLLPAGTPLEWSHSSDLPTQRTLWVGHITLYE